MGDLLAGALGLEPSTKVLETHVNTFAGVNVQGFSKISGHTASGAVVLLRGKSGLEEGCSIYIRLVIDAEGGIVEMRNVAEAACGHVTCKA